MTPRTRFLDVGVYQPFRPSIRPNQTTMGNDLLQDLRLRGSNPSTLAQGCRHRYRDAGPRHRCQHAMFSGPEHVPVPPCPIPTRAAGSGSTRNSIHSNSLAHSVANFVDLRQRNEVFEDWSLKRMGPVLTRDGSPRSAPGHDRLWQLLKRLVCTCAGASSETTRTSRTSTTSSS
jgi:hypothetical protein